MAARSVTRLTILVLSFGALLAPSYPALAQSTTPGKPTAGLAEIISAVSKAPARKVTIESSRQALYPSFSQRLDAIFSELLRRPSALAPSPLARESGPSAQGLSDMLERAREPHAPRQASAPAFSLNYLVSQSLQPNTAGKGAERSRRQDLVDALRVAVPSDGQIPR